MSDDSDDEESWNHGGAKAQGWGEGPTPDWAKLIFGGVGSPPMTRLCGKHKPFVDGGGLPSVGRWPPERRRGPLWGTSLREELTQLLFEQSNTPAESSTSAADRLELLLRDKQKDPEDPFGDALLERVRGAIGRAVVQRTGVPLRPEVRSKAPGQPFYLVLVEDLAAAWHDPDHTGVPQYRDGVPTGYGVEMPRTPLVYEEKTKWRFAGPLAEEGDFAANYPSLEENADKVRAIYEEDKGEGMMIGPLSREEAEARFPNLKIAATGAIAKDLEGGIRVIHDATHTVGINHKIRVRDMVDFPGLGEGRWILAYLAWRGLDFVNVKADVRKAHRRIKVREEDWGLLGCQVDPGEIYINKVGSFGVASASYWWQRLMGILVRLVGVLMLGIEYFQLLYADDFQWSVDRCHPVGPVGVILLFLSALGVPWTWKKLGRGREEAWVGYAFDYVRFEQGLAEKRAAWLREWIQGWLGLEKAKPRTLQEFLGRLQWAAAGWDLLRPLLGPLFAWVAAAPLDAELHIPPMVRVALTLWEEVLGKRTMWPARRPVSSGVRFRGDAKAGDGMVGIGAHEANPDGTLTGVRWFSVVLTPENAAWAFTRGVDGASRVIASLELLTTLIAVVVFGTSAGEAWSEQGVDPRAIDGVTDNLGNSYVVSKMHTTKFPLYAVLAELGLRLQHGNFLLRLRWKRRDENVEADALSEGRTEGFDPARQLEVKLEAMEWLVMDRLLEAGAEWVLERETHRKAKDRERREQRKRWGGKARKLDKGWNA